MRSAGPLLSLLLLVPALAGCYRAHDASGADASTASVDAPLDTGVDDRHDAHPTDAAPDAPRDVRADAGRGRCEGWGAEPLLHLCSFESRGSLPAGEPSTLSLFRGECVCAGERGCDVRVEGNTLELETWRCPSTDPCDDCAADAQCAIPALEAGVYAVRVDGVPLATIAAVSGPPMTMPTCWDVQDDLAGLHCGGAPIALPPREICHRPLEDVGTQVEITLVQTLPACVVPSECRATLEGRRIVLTATARLCAGDGGCGGAPMEHAARCITPPLRDGDYTIHVEGSAIVSPLRIRDITGRGEVSCAAAP